MKNLKLLILLVAAPIGAITFAAIAFGFINYFVTQANQAPGPPVVVPDTPVEVPDTPVEEVVQEPPPEPEPTGLVDNWVRDVSSDDFDGSRITEWCLLSTEDTTVSLPFPYQGEQRMVLCIQNRNRETSVYFSVLRGQIICPLRDCSVSILHGPLDAELWDLTLFEAPFVRASGGNSTTIFSRDTSTLIHTIQDSERLRVRINFYQHGNHTFEFHTHMDQRWF